MNDFVDLWVKIIEADQQDIKEGGKSAFESEEVDDGKDRQTNTER